MTSLLDLESQEKILGPMNVSNKQLFEKYLSVFVLTTLYLVPNISIYPSSKFPFSSRFISTYTFAHLVSFTHVVVDPGTVEMISSCTPVLLTFWSI